MDLYVCFQPHHFKAFNIADFLRTLLRPLRGHVILLWDRGSIHQGPTIAAVQQAYPRLHVEEFPAYAPALNPVEQICNDFKGHTANSRPYVNTRRVRRSQAKLRACILSSRANCN